MSVTFLVAKKSLEDAVKLLDSVPTRNGIVSSEFIKVANVGKKLTLAVSSDISAEAEVRALKLSEPFEKALFIDRRMLFPFVTSGEDFQTPMYEFTVEDKLIFLRHGSRRAQFENNSSASGYESIPKLEKAVSVEVTEEWGKLAACAILCACSDPIAPQLNCVHIMPVGDKIKVRASDTKLVFQGSLSKKTFPCDTTIALPLDIIDKLTLFANGVCYYSPKWALLQFPVGMIWQAVKVESRKLFPYESIERLVEETIKTGHTVMKLGSQSLVEAAERIATYLASVSRDNPVLHLHVKQGKKVARLYSDTVGASFNEVVKLEEAAVDDFQVQWPLTSVLPILRYCKNTGSARVLKNPAGASCLKTGAVTLLVPPPKAKGSKKK